MNVDYTDELVANTNEGPISNTLRSVKTHYLRGAKFNNLKIKNTKVHMHVVNKKRGGFRRPQVGPELIMCMDEDCIQKDLLGDLAALLAKYLESPGEQKKIASEIRNLLRNLLRELEQSSEEELQELGYNLEKGWMNNKPRRMLEEVLRAINKPLQRLKKEDEIALQKRYEQHKAVTEEDLEYIKPEFRDLKRALRKSNDIWAIIKSLKKLDPKHNFWTKTSEELRSWVQSHSGLSEPIPANGHEHVQELHVLLGTHLKTRDGVLQQKIDTHLAEIPSWLPEGREVRIPGTVTGLEIKVTKKNCQEMMIGQTPQGLRHIRDYLKIILLESQYEQLYGERLRIRDIRSASGRTDNQIMDTLKIREKLSVGVESAGKLVTKIPQEELWYVQRMFEEIREWCDGKIGGSSREDKKKLLGEWAKAKLF